MLVCLGFGQTPLPLDALDARKAALVIFISSSTVQNTDLYNTHPHLHSDINFNVPIMMVKKKILDTYIYLGLLSSSLIESVKNLLPLSECVLHYLKLSQQLISCFLPFS